MYETLIGMNAAAADRSFNEFMDSYRSDVVIHCQADADQLYSMFEIKELMQVATSYEDEVLTETQNLQMKLLD